MKVVNSLNKHSYFCAERKDKDKNPITKSGERSKLLKATAIAGLGVGAEALWYLIDDGFMFENIFDWSDKIVEKNQKNVAKSKKNWSHLGAFGLLTGGFIVGIAALYTAYKTPEIMYNGKVNAFRKSKDMDVYIKSNEVERELYNQMNDKAKDATGDEKEVLSQQYLKLKAAKNQTPNVA